MISIVGPLPFAPLHIEERGVERLPSEDVFKSLVTSVSSVIAEKLNSPKVPLRTGTKLQALIKCEWCCCWAVPSPALPLCKTKKNL